MRRIRFALVLVFAFFLSSLPLDAQVTRWVPVGPGGGTVLVMAADMQRPGLIYAGAEGSGVYRSGNSGHDWSYSSRGITNRDIRSMLIDAADTDTLLVGTFGGGVFKSEDGGCTWKEVNEGLTELSIFALGAGTEDNSYLAGTLSGGVFRSLDGAATWDPANNGLPAGASITEILRDSVSSTLYLSALGSGAYRSIDNGASWQSISNGLFGGLFAMALAQSDGPVLYAGAGAGVFRSDDGGESWNFLLPGPRTLVTQVAVDPEDAERVFAGTIDQGVFRSLDGGQTWTKVNTGLTDQFVETLIFDPHDSSVLYVSTEAGGAYRSDDLGATWNSLNDQLTAFSTNSIAVDQANPDVLYQGAARGGLTRSQDGGQSWQPVLQESGLTILEVTIDPSNPNRVFAPGGADGLYRTTNGGQTWSRISQGLSGIIRTAAIDSGNSNRVFAAGNDGIFVSLNGGESWQDSDQGLTSVRVNRLIADPADPQTFYAATQSDVFHSHDGGSTWQPSDEALGGPLTSLAAAGSDTPVLYAAGPESGIFRSFDQGHSWETIGNGLDSPQVESLHVPAENPDRILAGTREQGVFDSFDRGMNWIPLGQGLNGLRVTSLVSSPQGRIYAGTLGSVWRFDRDARFLHFAQYGQGSIGEARISSELLLIDLDPEQEAEALLSLRGDDGAPLKVRLNGVDIVGDRIESVPAGGLHSSLSGPDASLAAGSLTVQSESDLAGVLLFAGTVGVAGVGNSDAFENGFGLPLELDSVLGINTGIAIVSLEPEAVDFEARLFDVDRTLLARTQFGLAAGGHAALFPNQFEWQPEPGVVLDFDDFEGLLEVDGGRATATVLQTRPGELATLPVFGLDLLAAAGNGSGDTLRFAQFGAGVQGNDRLDSRILLVNLNLAQEANVVVRFRDDEGQPVTVTINGSEQQGEVSVTIPPGALRTLDTEGQQDLVSGSVSVESTQPLAGVILFKGSVGVAGVPDSAALEDRLIAPVISLEEGSVNTGIAVQEAGGVETRLDFTLFAADRTAIASAELTLPANGHRALFVNQFAWQVEPGQELDFTQFRGLLEVRFSGRIAATAIQTRPAQFATLPVR